MDFLANWKAKHIGGPSGKVSKIRVNTPRSGDITCMPGVPQRAVLLNLLLQDTLGYSVS